MLLLLKTVFVFLLFLVSVDGDKIYKKFICSINDFAVIKADEIAFYESPNFPELLSELGLSQCSINFTVNHLIPEEKNKRFLYVDTSRVNNDMGVITFNTTHNFTSVVISESNKHLFSGFVLFDDWNDDCPLESISRIEPFNFVDDTQVIALQSSYDLNSSQTHSCLWQFTAPEGYGFKIFITSLDLREILYLKIENKISVIGENLQLRIPYYYKDNYLKIYLSKNVNSTNPNKDIAFQSYLTIIKNKWEINDANCRVSFDDIYNVTTWTNYDPVNGYPKNSKCTYTLVISPHTVVYAYLYRIDVEVLVDHIYFYYDGNNSIPMSLNVFDLTEVVLDALDSKTERQILWEFNSDGSIQYTGFEVGFKTIECACAEPILNIPCIFNQFSFSIMNEESLSFYCGNMECHFNLIFNSTCSPDLFQFRIYTFFKFTKESFDIVKILIDNQTEYRYDYFVHRGIKTLILPTAANISLQINTVSSFHYRTMDFDLDPVYVPNITDYILLTTEKPWHVFSFRFTTDSLYVIQMSPDLIAQNATFELFSSIYGDDDGITVYEDESLTKQINLENCTVANLLGLTLYLHKCKILRSKFVLFKHEEMDILFIQSTTVYSKNCVFETNVFRLSDSTWNSSTTMLSSKENKCTIFLLKDDTHKAIKKIWVSPKSEGKLKIYSGDKMNLIVDINIQSALFWKDIILTSPFYVIEIPKNSAILLFSEKGYNNKFDSNVSTFPYYSFISSPLYGMSNKIICTDYGTAFSYRVENYPSKLTMISFNVPDSFILYLSINDSKIGLTSTFTSEIIYNSNISLHVISKNNSLHCTDSMEFAFLLETINIGLETKPTTATTEILTSEYQVTTQPSIAYFVNPNMIICFLIFYISLFF